jgi:hypothetical protein
MDVLFELGALGLPFGIPWLDFDDANVGMGHKEFMSVINRTVAKFTQMARFYGGVNSCWNLPLKKLFESNIMAVANLWIRMVGKSFDLKWAWAKVHEIKPNEFKSSPPYHYPHLCTLKFRNPSMDPQWPEGAKVVKAYEDKKLTFFKKHFVSSDLRAQEEQAMVKAEPKKGPQQYIDFVLANLPDFMDQGELSFSKIQAGPLDPDTHKPLWLLSNGAASRVKGGVTRTLEGAQSTN